MAVTAAAATVNDDDHHIVRVGNVDFAVAVHVGRVWQDDVANDVRESAPAHGSTEFVGTAHGHVERSVLIGLVLKHILVDGQRLALIDLHLFYRLTTVECLVADVCQRGGEGQRCERLAKCERLVSNPFC